MIEQSTVDTKMTYSQRDKSKGNKNLQFIKINDNDLIVNNNKLHDFLLLSQGSKHQLLMELSVQEPSLNFIDQDHSFLVLGVVTSSRNKLNIPYTESTYNNYKYTCLRLELGSMSISTTRTNSAEVPRRATLRSKLFGKRLLPA
jgi:hypothetical protein